ncbi:unnamed protein product, partial [Mesorhabditis belari]|uniref:cDENN domain-containing protein n=1 Tax=Mesorhabditis belari TaxID=2138241 RepID=A0AAF3EEH6_9BILA
MIRLNSCHFTQTSQYALCLGIHSSIHSKGFCSTFIECLYRLRQFTRFLLSGYISHLMYEVSFPSLRRPPQDEQQLPQYGAALFEALKSLGADNMMYLLPWLLTAVAESVCTLMFPFHWQCPYVPTMSTKYFDLYEDPPHDVTCFDLDTQTISGSTARHEIKTNILPKKPMKRLRAALEALNKQIQTQDFAVGQMQTKADYVETRSGTTSTT